MRGTKGCDPVRGGESQKAALSSDRGLQPDLVKSESLVIADQQYAMGPRSRALYTPPVTPRKWATPEAGGPTLVEGAVERVGLAIGVKS